MPQSDSRSVGSLPQPLVSANDQGRRSHPSQVTGNVDVAEPAQRSGYNVSEGNDADVHSLISSRSSRMSSSSKSTIARKARLAALQQQKQFRILEQSLERDRLINEQKSRELKLDMEISMAQAELRIFEQFDDGGSPDPDISFKVPQRTEVQDDRLLSWVEGQQNVNAPETNMQNLRPTAVDFMPVQEPNQHRDQFHQRLASPFVEPNVCKIISPSPQTSAGDINRIIESLGDTLKGSQLPKLKLSVFSGDPLEFQQWLVTFKAVIEDKSTDPAGRMQYLMQFTSGEPRTLISSYLLDQSSTGYASALQELIKEFGDPVVLARAYLGKIDTWQTIKTNDAAALKSLAIFLKKCRGSIPSLRHLQQLNTDLYLQKIIAKLPFPLQLSWRKTVDTLEQNNKDVTFNELVNFIDREARIAKHPVFSSVALAEAEGKNRAADTKLSVNKVSNPRSNAAYTAKVQVTKTSDFLDTRAEEYSAEPAVQASLRECMCSQSHDLDSCEVFLNKPVDERKAFLIKNRLCFGCYGHTSKTHDVRTCRKRRKCKICGKLHATGLHGSLPKKQPDNSSANAENETLVKTAISRATAVPIQDGGGIAMSLVMVRLTSGEKPDKSLVVYAALDNMSSACFISKDVWQRLGSPGNAAEITVKTINEERHQETVVVNNLYVSSVVDNTTIRLPKVFTQDTLPIDVSETPSHRVIANYPHLRHLTTEIPDRDETIPVGLLIGVNCPKALEPRGFIESVDNGPFAIKTSLGWCISGPLRPNDGQYADPVFSCNRTIVSAPRLLVQENDVKEMMIQMYESEFNEIPSCKNCSMLGRKDHKCDAKVSQDDVRFLTKMNAECNKIDGHYELPLPFRQQDVVLPNNRNQAVKRAEGIKRRFASNAKYKEDYSRFMKDIIGRGYVKKLSENSDTARIGENCWYIPHHGVYHPRKPDKIRVVFDCSARYAGISLNDKLLSGPNLSNSLVGVLIRFRQENIAIAADVECMFYQVKLPPSDRNYLRFLWWPDGNTNLELQDYEMCVHPFGAASSPSCANFALKRTADDNERQFGSKAADTLRENFYVDDMLKSVSSVTEAVKLVEDVRSMCAAGGFRLTKFVSNNEQVICSIPPSDRAKDFVDLDLVEMPIERALGVHWCIQNDSIIFRITLQDKPLTRRGMLSTVSSIYDPLGLAAPFLLEGKRLLQQVCNSNKGWDDDLNDDHKSAWERWRLNLPRLEQIEVQRSFKPTEFHSIKSATLHHFSDASQSGYGQCSYIRLVDESNKINCSLMMGKSRVVPLKPVTVPRLELTAACVSAKVGRMLETELQYENLTSVYWTDSNAVLGYINNDARRFHTFVANRVQQIREISEAESWKYINTLENPADDASRGIDILNISSDHRWFKGPEFIWLSEDHWPSKYLPKDHI